MRTALATLATLVVAGVAQANVSITGHGKVTFVPNMAYVHASVSNDAKTAAEAWQKNEAAVKKIFAALKSLGIQEKDFKTTGEALRGGNLVHADLVRRRQTAHEIVS